MRLIVHLVFPLRKVILTLVAIAMFFLILDSAAYFFSCLFAEDFIELVDITLEGNLPTWFSSTQLLFAGLCAYFIAKQRSVENKKHKANSWFVIAGFFAYMGIDDASQLHERVATITADVFLDSNAGFFLIDVVKDFPSYYWLVIVLPIFAALGLFMLFFLLKEFETKEVMRLFLIGIGFYVAAVGLDYFDGIESYYDSIVEDTLLTFGDARHISRAIEEFIEMVGTTFIVVAFLQHWQRIQLSSPSQSSYVG